MDALSAEQVVQLYILFFLATCLILSVGVPLLACAVTWLRHGWRRWRKPR